MDDAIRRQLEVIAMDDPMISRAMKDWENVSADPKLRELYFDRRKAVIDRMAAAKAAELREQRALTEGREKGRAEGRAEGQSLMAQDAICQYLNARFGTASESLQAEVRGITDLESLTRLLNRIFKVTSLDEAQNLIQDIIS